MHSTMESADILNVYDSEEDESYEFSLPEECQLPDFLNSLRKWNDYVYDTKNLQLWSELSDKINSCSGISIKDKDYIQKCMAEDLIYIHGMRSYFPRRTCRFCAIPH